MMTVSNPCPQVMVYRVHDPSTKTYLTERLQLAPGETVEVPVLRCANFHVYPAEGDGIGGTEMYNAWTAKISEDCSLFHLDRPQFGG